MHREAQTDGFFVVVAVAVDDDDDDAMALLRLLHLRVTTVSSVLDAIWQYARD